MAQANRSTRSVEESTGSVDGHVTEAFFVLASETRLEILFALWELMDPLAGTSEVSFSELRDRVGIRDSGQLNYHLEKLEGKFVRNIDGGYELSQVGRTLVQSVVAGPGIDEPVIESTEVDKPCKYCGAPTAVFYSDKGPLQALYGLRGPSRRPVRDAGGDARRSIL